MISAREKWQVTAQEPQVLEFLRGLFDSAGVRVTDTGEVFTCSQQEGAITFEDGIDQDRVDFIVEIDSTQVDRLASEAGTNGFSEIEKYRILRALLGTPLAYSASLMNNRLLGNPLLRKALRVVDVAHIYAQSPSAEEPDETFTLSLQAGGWVLDKGIHGKARRVLTLDLENALNFHRKTLAFKKSHGVLATLSYLAWYIPWRWRVSKRV